MTDSSSNSSSSTANKKRAVPKKSAVAKNRTDNEGHPPLTNEGHPRGTDSIIHVTQRLGIRTDSDQTSHRTPRISFTPRTRLNLGSPFSALQLAIQSAKNPASDSSLSSVPPSIFQLPEMLSYCLSSDLSTLLHCSGDTESILGIPEKKLRTQGGLLIRHVHFDDRFRVLNSLEEALLKRTSLVFAYRWTPPNPAIHSILINHCVASQSDIGEVITGTLFHVSPQLQEELNLLFERGNLPTDLSHTTGDGKPHALIFSTLLDEELRCIGPGTIHKSSHHFANGKLDPSEDSLTKDQKNRCLPFLPWEQEREILRQLAARITPRLTKRSHQDDPRQDSASEHLFHRDTVYLATLRRIEQKTFSPHFGFTLKDITEQFLQSHELKSLRYMRNSLSAAKSTLTDAERGLDRLLSSASLNPKIREQLSEAKEDIAASLSNISQQMLTPFVSGKELLLESLGTLSRELGCEVELHVQVKKHSLYVWRSIATILIEQLEAVSAQLLPVANRSQCIRIMLDSIEDNTLLLELYFFIPQATKEELSVLKKHLDSPENKRILHPMLTLQILPSFTRNSSAKESLLDGGPHLQVRIMALGAIHPGNMGSTLSDET
ncbi:MAG: hypothetical protein ACO3XO_09435 [Bdellovibrionota bacterium]